MRPLILIAGLALASCGSDNAANNAAVSEESRSAQVTAVNDTTAIDAATGEAADMAADVNYTFDDLENGAGNTSGNAGGNESTNSSR